VGGLLVVTRHARGGQGRESYWAMSDLNGNVTGLVSATSARMAVYEYDAFGRLLRENEPEPGLNPVRFSSKYQDVETGLVYYGYRYYAPEMGRWISRDPIEEEGGLNLYGMVGNDAVNRWDPLGLTAQVQVSESKRDEGTANEYILVSVIVKARIHWDDCPNVDASSFPSLAKQRQMTESADKMWDVVSTKHAYGGSKPIFFGLFGSRPIWKPAVKYDMRLDISATYGMAGDERPRDADLISLGEIAKPGPSYVNRVGGDKMVLRKDWGSGSMLFEHEMGHVIGAEDFYIQNQPNDPGRMTVPYSREWDGNLMADRGPNLNWRNVEDILRFHGKRLSFQFSVEEGGVRTQNPLPRAYGQ
jgi:RHS repeat-associated protein